MVSEEKWWEQSDTELEDMIEDRLEGGPLNGIEETPETSIDSGGENTRVRILGISTGVLSVGFLSPWGWYESGFQALRWSFQDVQWILNDGLSFYSEWGMNPLDYIHWLMGPLLPLVFVTTFVATWYKSQEGDEEFGRKASIFHLSFFGVLYLIPIMNGIWGHYPLNFWLPTEWDYGMWIAAASGIGLHPTAYGLAEKLSNIY